MTAALNFFEELKQRNSLFYYFSLFFLALSFLFLIGFAICTFEPFEICTWLKSGKFAISFAVYLMTLGWFTEYLKPVLSQKRIQGLSLFISLFVLVEMIINILQGFMLSDSYKALLISPAATETLTRQLFLSANTLIVLNTVLTFYIALMFFKDLPLKPVSYLWSIRAGFVVFFISCFLGSFILGHYGEVPLNETSLGIPFIDDASRRDLLISIHFLGIHFLQILPLASYYFASFFKKPVILSIAALYCLSILLALKM